MVFITLLECPCWTYGGQETARFKGLSRSVDFCDHKFKKVPKAGLGASAEINLFKALLILAITRRPCI